MKVSLDLNEEHLEEPARELWSISQEDADCQDPGEVIEAVREVITTLEEWILEARVKAGAWLS
jgi:hypothetical protein